MCPDLLARLAELQLQRFTAAAGCLRGKLSQLGPLGPGIRALLVGSLCTSHLLFGAVVWGPVPASSDGRQPCRSDAACFFSPASLGP